MANILQFMQLVAKGPGHGRRLYWPDPFVSSYFKDLIIPISIRS